MAEEQPTTTLVTPEKLPSSDVTPPVESEPTTQEVLPRETETPEKVTETNPPESAETTTKPEEETTAEHHPPTVTETETASTEKQELGDESSSSQKEVAEEKKSMIPQNLGSFKEESSKLSDLSNSEKKSLDELKHLVRDALDNHQFSSIPKPEDTNNTPDEVKIWGIPLLEDDRSDVVLLKFLRARDFKVKDSFAMLKNTVKWRREFKIDELVEEELVDDLDKVVFMHGHDREGHPVCYNVYGEFQNKELYNKTFSDEEKRKHFLRTRIQFLERSIRKLDFSSGGVSTIFQVNDMKNSPGLGKKELRSATKQAVELLQDNYPEFVFKQVHFPHGSFVYMVVNLLLSWSRYQIKTCSG